MGCYKWRRKEIKSKKKIIVAASCMEHIFEDNIYQGSLLRVEVHHKKMFIKKFNLRAWEATVKYITPIY